MTIREIIESQEFRSVVDDYRGMCLWNLPEDFMPQNERQIEMVIDNLEHYGDLSAYRRAGTSWEMDRRTLETAGYSVRHLLSAACGKDPGFSPSSMLEYVARRHYNQVEIDDRIIPRGAYDAGELCRFWHEHVEYTREAVAVFPRDKAGMCVLDREGKPYKGSPLHLPNAIASGEVVFREGRICGAWPQIVG